MCLNTNHNSKNSAKFWILKGISGKMESCLGAERAGSSWWADPKDPAHQNEMKFPSLIGTVKSSQVYLYSTFHVQNNSKCFTEIKALQQGAEKALKM